MKRPTIADIAEAAGVSKGAVSYALNGKAGVLRADPVAHSGDRQADGLAPEQRRPRAVQQPQRSAIGLVVDRPAWVLGIEPFFMQLISGVEAGLAASGTALLLQVTEDADAEEAAYRRWWGERRVDGVLLVDLRDDDHRLGLLGELELPGVVIGHATGVPGLRRSGSTTGRRSARPWRIWPRWATAGSPGSPDPRISCTPASAARRSTPPRPNWA